MELATKTTINCESIYNECVWVKQGTHDNHRLQTKTWIEENKFLPFENMKFLCRKSVFTRNFFIAYKGIRRKYELFNDWQLKNQLRPLFQLLAEVRELENANSGDSRSFLFLLCSVVTPIPWYKQSSLSSKLSIIKRKALTHNIGTETKMREDAEIT
jgi:hypothetical protein